MSKLQEQLVQLKARTEENLPPPFLKIIKNSVSQLVQSGIEGRVLKLANVAPQFCLEDHLGERFDYGKRIQQGPLILTFYRGFW